MLVIGWVCVAGYIYFGGQVLRKLELNSEKVAADNYCEKIDMLMSGMASYQRQR
jgi:hypothetical protein